MLYFFLFQSWELRLSGFVCLILKRPFPVSFGLGPAPGMAFDSSYTTMVTTIQLKGGHYNAIECHPPGRAGPKRHRKWTFQDETTKT